MKAKSITLLIGIWIIIKSIINLCIGFNANNITYLIAAIVITVLFVMEVPYINFIVGGLMSYVVLKNIGYNISNSQILYLIEAAIDIVCIVILFVSKDIRDTYLPGSK